MTKINAEVAETLTNIFKNGGLHINVEEVIQNEWVDLEGERKLVTLQFIAKDMTGEVFREALLKLADKFN